MCKKLDKRKKPAGCIKVKINPEHSNNAIMWLIKNNDYRQEMMDHHINYYINREKGIFYFMNNQLAVEFKLLWG